MDTIRLDGLVAVGHHGVLPEEKAAGQKFVVDVALRLDLASAGRSDDLADTVSYAEIGTLVETCVADGSLDLVEALAARIAAAVLRHDTRIEEVDVVVHKPHAPMPAHHGTASVAITRSRADLDAGRIR